MFATIDKALAAIKDLITMLTTFIKGLSDKEYIFKIG